MTEAMQPNESVDEPESDADLEAMLDAVNLDPSILRAMVASLLAVDMLLAVMPALYAADPEHASNLALQEIILASGVAEVRDPTPEEAEVLPPRKDSESTQVVAGCADISIALAAMSAALGIKQGEIR